jgi:glycosyltransferase involved in cell wall biosynthesis
MARALHEAGQLHEFVSRGIDSFRTPWVRRVRQLAGRAVPAINRQLGHRVLDGIPPDVARARWGWEVPRLVAARVGLVRLEDWIWERGEHALDAYCARQLRQDDVGGFFGIQHGALAALITAGDLGKPGLLGVLSPHRDARARFVEREYAREPALSSATDRRLRELARPRDRRVDEELRRARWIVTGSSFTTRSLTDAGVDVERILTVPLGGPEPVGLDALPPGQPSKVRFVYAGNVSVLKGAHYLLRAWARLRPSHAELHVYGKHLLPRLVLADLARRAGPSVVFHGSVPPDALARAYVTSSVLVLPTLADGFGQVVTEALAHGLPVIVTRNAGAADVVTEGVTGWVIPSADEDALAERIEWCLNHREALVGMRRSALKAAAANTWTAFRARFTAAIATALDAAPRP